MSGHGRYMSTKGRERASFVPSSCPVSCVFLSGGFLFFSPDPCLTVCENCMEVNLMEVATIIVVDICVTLGLLLLVYYWSKSRKAKASPMTRGAGAGGRPRGKIMEEMPTKGGMSSLDQVKTASLEQSWYGQDLDTEYPISDYSETMEGP